MNRERKAGPMGVEELYRFGHELGVRHAERAMMMDTDNVIKLEEEHKPLTGTGKFNKLGINEDQYTTMTKSEYFKYVEQHGTMWPLCFELGETVRELPKELADRKWIVKVGRGCGKTRMITKMLTGIDIDDIMGGQCLSEQDQNFHEGYVLIGGEVCEVTELFVKEDYPKIRAHIDGHGWMTIDERLIREDPGEFDNALDYQEKLMLWGD